MSQISFSSSRHCQNKSAGHTSKATPTPSKPVASHVTQPGMSASPPLCFLVLKSTISFEFQNLSGKCTSLKNQNKNVFISFQLSTRTKAVGFV